MKDLKPSEKYALSIEEAAIYFHIGMNKLRKMVSENPEWVFKCGTHSYIKREKLEKLLDRASTV